MWMAKTLVRQKTFTRTEQLYILSHNRSWGWSSDPIKPVWAPPPPPPSILKLTVPRRHFCCGSLLLFVLAVRIYTLVHLLCKWHILVKFRKLYVHCCSFRLPRVPFVYCCQFIYMYLVISLLVLRAGYGIIPDPCSSFYFLLFILLYGFCYALAKTK